MKPLEIFATPRHRQDCLSTRVGDIKTASCSTLLFFTSYQLDGQYLHCTFYSGSAEFVSFARLCPPLCAWTDVRRLNIRKLPQLISFGLVPLLIARDLQKIVSAIRCGNPTGRRGVTGSIPPTVRASTCSITYYSFVFKKHLAAVLLTGQRFCARTATAVPVAWKGKESASWHLF